MARTSPSVLIVDDSSGVSTAIAMMLEEDGFLVEIADSYQSGLQAILAGNFRLLIIDVNLGTDSGVNLAAEVVRQNLPCKIILTSGLLDLSPELERHPDLKRLPILLKPFGRQGLLECVQRTLEEAAA